MAGGPEQPLSESGNPLDAVFEKAVRPYKGGAALKRDLPPDTPIAIMKKGEELPTETRELDGGGTLTIPVLGALKDAKLASWHRVGDFDFDSLEPDAVGLLLMPRGSDAAAVRVVTRASDGALLVADLDGMLDALKALVDQPAFKAFPGGDFLTDALIGGITAAKEDLGKALAAPDAQGKSLYDQFKEPAGARQGKSAPAKGKKKA
jgi:hypothetical protein